MLRTVPLLEDLRHALADARDEGVPFDEAWTTAVRALRGDLSERDNGLWGGALAGTRDAWRRAYSGEPATPADKAPGELIALLAAG